MEPEVEELAEILESFEALKTTNKAFDQSREFDENDDTDFKNTLDRIRNRNVTDRPLRELNSDKTGDDANSEENLSSYEKINELIEKRSGNEGGILPSDADGNRKNSTVSYSLVGRTDIYMPPPIYLCEEGGKMVISIQVNAKGQVTEASYNNSSTSQNGCLLDHALEYAKAAKFNSDPTKPSQLGTITFFFRGKRR